MEEIENFYLKILSRLKTIQSKRLYSERQLPLKIDLHEKHTETRKARKLLKKSELQRKKIEKGYYKGIEESINVLEKVYKETLKCYSDD